MANNIAASTPDEVSTALRPLPPSDLQETNNSLANVRGDETGDDESSDDVIDHVLSRLSRTPAASDRPDLVDIVRPVLERWRDAFGASHPVLWRRKIKRSAGKEIGESAFVIGELMELLGWEDDDDGRRPNSRPPATIVDLCSRMGFLSMLLSHLLPPERVSRIIAVDVLFRSANDPTGDVDEVEGDEKHLSTSHLLSPAHPIPILPRRVDLKKGRELRNLVQRHVLTSPGPVIVVGVHLCKALSVRAVRLFNMGSPRTERLYLKPCCLPGRRGLQMKRPVFWEFKHMEGGGFGLEDLYCKEVSQVSEAETGSEVADNEDGEREERRGHSGKKVGGHHSTTSETEENESSHLSDMGNQRVHNILFSRWVELLNDAIDPESGTVKATIEHRQIQVHHFQNQYIVAHRSAETLPA